MTDRRQFLKASVAATVWPGLLGGCSVGEGGRLYEDVVQELWRETPVPPADTTELYWDLVRHARLAPSTHNSQCWQFGLEHNLISIHPDPTRRCPVADPDDHHVYVSLGCALENLVLTAEAKGLHAEVNYSAGNNTIEAWMSETPASASPLYAAITRRQSTRSEYDGKPVPAKDLKQLQTVAQGQGISVLLITAPKQRDEILDRVMQGNSEQLGDAAFREELKGWIRFNEYDAVVTCDGLYTRTFASPPPELPSWLGQRAFDLFLSPSRENDRIARQVRSSSGIAIFHSEDSTPDQWLEVGRAFQRFALQATVLGIRTAMINQPVEVPALRAELAKHLGLGNRRPDLVVRFGYGPEMPRSLRRLTKDAILGIRCM